jgi:hypothetical protein
MKCFEGPNGLVSYSGGARCDQYLNNSHNPYLHPIMNNPAGTPPNINTFLDSDFFRPFLFCYLSLFLEGEEKNKCDSKFDKILHTVQLHHDLAFNSRDIIMI